MVSKYLSIIGALLLVAGCASTGPEIPTTPEPETPVQPERPPRGEPVAMLDLVPQITSGAVFIDVAQLRDSQHAEAIVGVIRRIGGRHWEQRLDLDLTRDVERLVIYGESMRRRPPGNLAEAFSDPQAALRGFVVDLGTAGRPVDEICHQDDLQQIQAEEIQTPQGRMNLSRCGQYLVLTCCNSPLPGTSAPGGAANALQSFFDDAAASTPAIAVVIGDQLFNRVSCDPEAVPLTGWQTGRVDLEQGIGVHLRLRAASESDAPNLEECVQGGLDAVLSFPFLTQIGLGSVLDGVQITRDEAEDKDVLVDLHLDEAQVDTLMTLLDLVGEASP